MSAELNSIEAPTVFLDIIEYFYQFFELSAGPLSEVDLFPVVSSSFKESWSSLYWCNLYGFLFQN